MKQILFILLLAGIFSPAFSYFVYDQLAQQWYISSFCFLLLFLNFILSWIKTDEIKNHFVAPFRSATTIVLALECSYVCVNLKYSPVAGTMDSSTGLAMNICLLLPHVFARAISMRNKIKSTNNIGFKVKKIFTIVVLMLSVIVILLTHCRTGILCIIVFILIGIPVNSNNRFPKRSKATITIFLLIIVFIISSTSIKQNSNNGRSFIISNSIELIKERPVTGYPHSGFRLEYMNKQADYFRNHPNSMYMELADEINHPLNEYIYTWINYGLAGVVFLLIIVIFPIIVCAYRKQTYLLCSLCSIFLFSLLSYPFFYPLPILFLLFANISSTYHVLYPLLSHVVRRVRVNHDKVLIITSYILFTLGVSVILTQFSYCYKWNKTSYRAINGHGTEALSVFEELSKHYSDNPYFLYNYMSEAFHAGNLNKAYELSVHIHQMMSSYNLELLSGDICYSQHKYEQARSFYENAMYMCPCRFAPLEGLYKIFDATGDVIEKQRIAVIIAEKDIKVVSPDVIRIKEHCK